MKIIRIALIPILAFGILLTACMNSNHEDLSENVESTTFNSTQELVEYFSKNPEVLTELKNSYQNEIAEKTGNNISIYVPQESFLGATFNYIDLVGRNINYIYSLNGYTTSLSNTKADSSITNDRFANMLTVSYCFVAQGTEGLKEFVNPNSSVVFELKDYPGVYYGNVKPDGKNVVGEMIYWVRDDYFFQAYIPLQYIDELLKQTNGMQDFVVPVIYSSTTFEAIK